MKVVSHDFPICRSFGNVIYKIFQVAGSIKSFRTLKLLDAVVVGVPLLGNIPPIDLSATIFETNNNLGKCGQGASTKTDQVEELLPGCEFQANRTYVINDAIGVVRVFQYLPYEMLAKFEFKINDGYKRPVVCVRFTVRFI